MRFHIRKFIPWAPRKAGRVRQKEFDRILSKNQSPYRHFPSGGLAEENRVKMRNEEQAMAFKTYLKSLDKKHLNDVLNEVLNELRRRDSDQLKNDVLSQSQLLRPKNPTK
jgi:hypothetical protein